MLAYLIEMAYIEAGDIIRGATAAHGSSMTSDTAPPEWRSQPSGEVEFQQNHDRPAPDAGPVWRMMFVDRRPASGRALRRCVRGRRRRAAASAAKSGGSSTCGRRGDRRCPTAARCASRMSLGLGHEDRAVLEQAVGAAARGSSGEPGTAKTSRPNSPASRARDQRAGALRRLDHDKPERQAGDDPVAARKILRARLPAERHFARRCRRHARRSRRSSADVFRRVGPVEPAGEHADRAGGEAALMRRRVDAARQARRRPHSPRGRVRAASMRAILMPASEALRAPTMATAGRSKTAALPFTASSGGGSSMRREQRRIVRLADADEARADAFGRPPVRASASPTCGMRTTRLAPPRLRQFRQHLQRRFGRAEVVDQVAEGGRADIRRADQPQPVDPLPVAAVADVRLPCRSPLGSDPRFRPGQQPGDVGPVLDEDDHGS